MAIKAGEIIHVGNQVLVDRIQTGGPGTVNVPTEKIYEVGNYNSVSIVRDIADLTFNMESLDVSAEFESLLLGTDFDTDGAGTEYDLANAQPIDVVSQFKAGRDAGDPTLVLASAAIPYLSLESLSYRFGIRDNAAQSATLRGDSLFYAEASAYVEEFTGDGVTDQETFTLANAAIPYEGDTTAGTRYALSVTNVTTGTRLTPGTDYSDTANDVTLVEDATTDTFRVVYQSLTGATYPDVSHAAASAARPAAVKGKDVELRVGGVLVTDRWSSVQSVQVDFSVQLEKDEELGNAQFVDQDFDVPTVSGTVSIKPRSAVELVDKVKEIAGVSGDEVVGPYQVATLPMDIIIHSPTDGSVVKTLHVPDAQFTIPNYSAQVQQKLTVDMSFESETGQLLVYKGARP